MHQDDDEEDDGWDAEEVDEDKDRYRCARDGDYLMGMPFECDLCHFHNLNHRNPDLKDAETYKNVVGNTASLFGHMLGQGTKYGAGKLQ